MTPEQEKLLLEQVRDGNEAAFAVLVKEHSPRIISLAWKLVGNRADAEDIAQEAFLRLHRGLSSLREESRIATWLYRTASNLAIDHLRRQNLKRKLFFFRQNDDEPDPLEQVADPAPSPGELYQAGETGRLLSGALKKLSARQRAIFTLRHQEELPLKEIAALLKLEEGTVKAHLHRAVMALRKELEALQGGRG